MNDLKMTLKEYIIQEFLPGEDPDNLTDSTPLITGGILDSIGTVKLVAFIEEQYGIEFEAHEVAVEHLNTLSTIAAFVQAKL
jgi:acyl carrier protein